MGLLDYATDDKGKKADLSQALMAAGLGMLAARGVNPWQALGQGGLLGMQAMLENQQARRRDQLAAVENDYKKAQLEHANMTTQQLKQQMDDQKLARDVAMNYQTQGPAQTAMARMPSLAPTVENVAALSAITPAKQPSQYDYYMGLANAYQQKGLADLAMKIAEHAQKFRPEVKDTKTLMRDGKRVVVNIFKDGTQEVVPFGPDAEKLHFADTGGAVVGLDPFTGAQSSSPIAKTMDPAQIDASKRGWAGLAQAERHFNVTQGQPTFHEGQFVYKPTAENPQGATIQASGFTPKMPEAIRKELATLDAQEGTVNGAIKAVTETPSAFSGARGTATLAGTIPESIASRFDKPAEREARAYVYNVVSKVINERAGAAQSVQELARLRSFLPAETDRADQIVNKLNAFKKYIADQRSAFTKNVQVDPAKADPLGIR